jgi:hypothetical protein
MLPKHPLEAWEMVCSFLSLYRGFADERNNYGDESDGIYDEDEAKDDQNIDECS